MTIEKKGGVIIITDIIDGYLVTEKYIGYTVREAKNRFKNIYY